MKIFSEMPYRVLGGGVWIILPRLIQKRNVSARFGYAPQYNTGSFPLFTKRIFYEFVIIFSLLNPCVFYEFKIFIIIYNVPVLRIVNQ